MKARERILDLQGEENVKKTAIVIYQNGITEELQIRLMPNKQWRISSLPFGSDAIAFGDWVTLRTKSNVQIVTSVVHGGWRTIRAKLSQPPSQEFFDLLDSLGFLAAWSSMGILSIAALAGETAIVQEMLSRAEKEGHIQSSVSLFGKQTHQPFSLEQKIS